MTNTQRIALVASLVIAVVALGVSLSATSAPAAVSPQGLTFGTSNFGGSISVAGDATIGDDLTVVGDITAASIVTDGNATLTSLSTTGNVTITGDTHAGTVYVNGYLRSSNGPVTSFDDFTALKNFTATNGIIINGRTYTETEPLTITDVLTNVRLLYYQVP